MPRLFPAFTPKRLGVITKLLKRQSFNSIEHIVFHGSTPWIQYHPTTPYSVILDCAFSTYLKTYHQARLFDGDAIKQITDKEKIFLQNAHCVLFTSNWAIEQAKQDYQLSGYNFKYLGQGPSEDFTVSIETTALKNQFLFIASDFLGKGGRVVFEGFIQFLSLCPDYHLTIVGEKPPVQILNHPAVKYLGYIDKSSVEGKTKLATLYAESKANILLTQKDISPLVIIESGYAGCPTIANPVSAIPELIDDGITGWLIAPTAEQLAQTLDHHVNQRPEQLHLMRSAVKLKMKTQYNWDHIAVTLIDALQKPHAG